MKWMRKSLMRLLSAGTCLALVAGMLPAALAARPDTSYEVESDEVLKIDDEEFNDYCKYWTDGETMDYIVFTDLPSSREGTLYYEDDSRGNQVRVREGRKIDYNEFYALVFEPNEDFEGTVYIPFEGESTGDRWNSGTDYDGELEIEVTAARGCSSSSDGLLTYEIDVNETLDLSKADFDEYCKKETPAGYKVGYIEFTNLPSRREGTLYYNYGRQSEEKVAEGDRYSANAINDLTFVPADDYEGTVTLTFEGKTSDSKEWIEDDLVIHVGDNGSSAEGDVTYDVDKNDTVDLDVDDFDQYVSDETPRGTAVDYIKFTDLPSSRKGTLYYDYGTRNEKEAEEGTRYESDDIDSLTFVPARNFEGTVTLPFEGKSNKNESFTGDLVIRVGEAASGGSTTIELQVSSGGSVNFSATNFNNACVKATGSNLDYVSFQYDPGRSGILYHKYNQSGQSAVGDERYYRSGRPSLDDVTFVTSTGTGTSVTIPFRGKADSGRAFNGQVKISVATVEEPAVIRYTSNGKAVNFSAVDFVTACATSRGQLLTSVRFLSPVTTGGQLYYGFESPAKYQGKVSAGLQYSLVGSYQLNQVSFLPKAGYTGQVNIPYLGTDAAGITFSGTVNVTVTAPTASRFKDMSGYSWAVPAVEFLAEYGVTTGSGSGATYSPLTKMSRGDYILMLCRAFGLNSTQTASFSDVPANSYYAKALATAKSFGIATADASGKFRPKEAVTREDAMLFLYRTMKAANRPAAEAGDTVLARFPDNASITASNRSAVAAMVQAGVIQGNDQGKLAPKSTLTRAEMATILYRALTL